jgi:hypothetical protein
MALLIAPTSLSTAEERNPRGGYGFHDRQRGVWGAAESNNTALTEYDRQALSRKTGPSNPPVSIGLQVSAKGSKEIGDREASPSGGQTGLGLGEDAKLRVRQRAFGVTALAYQRIAVKNKPAAKITLPTTANAKLCELTK